MIALLLLVSQFEINLYVNKDTFLLGEDILVRWEIVNTGKKIEYFERNAELIKLTNDGILKNSEGREVPHAKMSGIQIVTDSTFPVDTIMPGDTVKFNEVNLIGIFGSLGFATAGFLNKYISPGKYYLSLFYYKGKDWSQKIYSDTLFLVVVEPTGKEKEAWLLYKKFKAAWNRINDEKTIEYGNQLLTKFPQSIYIAGTLEFLDAAFSSINKNEPAEKIKKIEPFARKLLSYLESNVDKIRGNERALKQAANCITSGEIMLGTPKEEVKQKILKMNVPVTSDIQKTLDIKPEELDTTKKK